MNRGDVHWCDFGAPSGSGPAKRRPVLVVQSDSYNRSRLATTVVMALTSNTALAAMPGNVFLPATGTGLSKDSVANVTALATVDRRDLDVHPVGRVPDHLMHEVDRGVRQVLALS
ncbi:type II toxin-antitoxin system PemK/MazF family toxin [Nocardioides humi]|uniref:type II toxin-antitoxin system PemK/MazF family toxin n=1 Tax=Nocardioides humi TaxID=449461 RepID=UPI002482A5FA|nr:type II toxin-antitoxin system PemK/MazF family toxin [Nocardioides humi]